ncbi:4-hydroxy-tetrahydrodipicolinate synthase [Francisella sp. SYW-9]|uniref:4-hydroxy-tetrahydrodipicolinate synthase n=1 Tax=Francisella sp. SYW-9 TaxID=2610888 RepID=UPI00123E3D68|nr:4-hydroxy-tetrahydrodipicolinate synthase [Francisella sp. SYW-9]
MKNINIEGIVAYIPTPFDKSDQISLKSLEILIDRLIKKGVDAISPLGSTGESAYLSLDEWKSVTQKTVEFTNKRVPVIVGASDMTTANCIEKAKYAQSVGADAIMVIPMIYWKLSEDDIFNHYKYISDAIDIPIVVYNNPSNSGFDMKPSFIAHLFNEIENVKMVKDSTGDIQRVHEIRLLTEDKLPIYCGYDPIAIDMLISGASGWCTAAANIIPELNIDLYKAIKSKNLAHASELFNKQYRFLKFIIEEGGLSKTIKSGLSLMGINVGNPRLPISPLSQDKLNELKIIMTKLNIVG